MALKVWIQKQKALKLYDWLDTIDVIEMQDILSRRREKDTCTWLSIGPHAERSGMVIGRFGGSLAVWRS